MKKRVLLALALSALHCASAWANGATGLMFLQQMALCGGNVIIGLVEGFALALLFRLPLGKTILLMIAANIFSGLVGYETFQKLFPLPLDLDNVMVVLYALIGASFVATLILEFPFLAILLPKKRPWFKKAACGFFVVQTVSYVALFAFYHRAIRTSIVTDVQRVDGASLDLPKDITLYYIAAEDGDVYKMSLADLRPSKYSELDSFNSLDSLSVRPVPGEARWQLMALQTRMQPMPSGAFPGQDSVRDLPIFLSVKETSLLDNSRLSGEDLSNVVMGTRSLGPVSSPYTFKTDVWAGEGLEIWKYSVLTKRLAMETPFMAWRVQNITHLPGDKALFQLSEDMICVYDLPSNRLALLARGHGPMAVRESPQS